MSAQWTSGRLVFAAVRLFAQAESEQLLGDVWPEMSLELPRFAKQTPRYSAKLRYSVAAVRMARKTANAAAAAIDYLLIFLAHKPPVLMEENPPSLKLVHR